MLGTDVIKFRSKLLKSRDTVRTRVYCGAPQRVNIFSRDLKTTGRGWVPLSVFSVLISRGIRLGISLKMYEIWEWRIAFGFAETWGGDYSPDPRLGDKINTGDSRP